jgi:hypothetical protein
MQPVWDVLKSQRMFGRPLSHPRDVHVLAPSLWTFLLGNVGHPSPPSLSIPGSRYVHISSLIHGPSISLSCTSHPSLTELDRPKHPRWTSQPSITGSLDAPSLSPGKVDNPLVRLSHHGLSTYLCGFQSSPKERPSNVACCCSITQAFDMCWILELCNTTNDYCLMHA